MNPWLTFAVVGAACAGPCAVARAREPAPEADPAELGVPPSAQYYEVVPGVVRSDGSQAFRVRVHVGRPVTRVFLSVPGSRFTVSRTGFLDDGTDGDEVAGDGVFTSGLFSLAAVPPPLLYLYETETLAGMDFEDTGKVIIEETDGSEVSFLVEPCVGLIDPSIGEEEATERGDAVRVSSHLVNVRSVGVAAAQNRLHLLGSGYSDDLRAMIATVLGELPDRYDFIVVFSSVHGESLPRTAVANGYAGLHITVRNEVDGIGVPNFDQSALYGSGGRLLGVNLVDTARRGAQINNVLHEVTHQWAASIDSSLGLTSGGPHWSVYSNAGSILGGYAWIPQSDGSWLLDGNQGRSRLRAMPAVDRYLAGFAGADEVTPLMLVDPAGKHPVLRVLDGDPVLPGEVVKTVTIDEILALQGERAPAVTDAQRHFTVLFVVESVDRFLTAEERTFYNRLASEFERLLPPSASSPILANNWVPATRYFGPGVTLSSRVGGQDADGDGLWDDWERAYFGDLTPDAADDPDGDGATHLEEMAWIGHPRWPDVRSPVRIYRDGAAVVVEGTACLPNLEYSMDTAVSPGGAWVAVAPVSTLGPHYRLVLSDVSQDPRRFFRARVEVPGE